jgi:tetratricopeptide (TPR) repeat protein
VLWALGGAAVTEQEAEDPGAQLLIALAGPVANFLVTAVLLIGLVATGLLSAATGRGVLGLTSSPLLRDLAFIIGTNLILALSNLLPIYPLDGGRIFRALLHMLAGPARSAQITFWISAVLALALSVWALLDRSWLLFGTALLLLFGAFSLNQGLMLGMLRVYARWFKRPEVYFRLADFDPAVALLTERINLEPTSDLYLQRAYAHYYLEDFLRARSDAERAVAANAANLPALLLQGAVNYSLGLTAEAWKVIERVDELRPDWSMGHLNRAVLLREAGKLDEALAEANQAVEKIHMERGTNISPVLVYLLRSLILYGMGDATRVQADWEAAQRFNAREAAAFSPDRAQIFSRDWAWTQAYFAWLEQHGADKTLLAISRGDVALRARQFMQAAANFDEAQKRQPALRDLCYYRGLAYLEMGRQADAAADFRRALQVSARGHIRRLAAARLKQVEANGFNS